MGFFQLLAKNSNSCLVYSGQSGKYTQSWREQPPTVSPEAGRCKLGSLTDRLHQISTELLPPGRHFPSGCSGLGTRLTSTLNDRFHITSAHFRCFLDSQSQRCQVQNCQEGAARNRLLATSYQRAGFQLDSTGHTVRWEVKHHHLTRRPNKQLDVLTGGISFPCGSTSQNLVPRPEQWSSGAVERLSLMSRAGLGCRRVGLEAVTRSPLTCSHRYSVYQKTHI